MLLDLHPFCRSYEWPDTTSGNWSLSGCLWQEVAVYFILYYKQHYFLKVPDVKYGAKYPCLLLATSPMMSSG